MGEERSSSSPVRSMASTSATMRRGLLLVADSKDEVHSGPVLGFANAFPSRLATDGGPVVVSSAPCVCFSSRCARLAAGSVDAYWGMPANTSLGFPPPGVARSLAMSKSLFSTAGGLCMSTVFVRVAVRGGGGWATGSASGGAGAAAGSLLTEGSIEKDEGCESVAELAGASGSYATSEAAHGMKGCSDNSHWRCFLRLFRGIRVAHRKCRGPHRQPTRVYAEDCRRVGVVVAMSRAEFTSRVVALRHQTRLLPHTNTRDL
jgi:hypothetical protein